MNVDGLSAFTPEFNRNDGFSPNNTIMARVPGIEDPAAFRANRLVPQVNIGAYDDPGQRVVLINADSGERHPIWAEVDMVPDAPGDRALLIHPAVALDYGTRYIVALRNLRSESGERLRPNRVFRAYRERLGTDNAAVEARRPEMERIFDELGRGRHRAREPPRRVGVHGRQPGEPDRAPRRDARRRLRPARRHRPRRR